MIPPFLKRDRLAPSLLLGRILLILVVTQFTDTTSLSAWDWVPSEEEIQKYRKSWNPFSHGPILLQAVDIQPKGQLSIREFLFSQIGESTFGNRLSFPTESKPGPVHVYQVSPSVNSAYGITDHIELGVEARSGSRP